MSTFSISVYKIHRDQKLIKTANEKIKTIIYVKFYPFSFDDSW